MAFIMLEICSLCIHFAIVSIINGCWPFVKCFFSVCLDDHVFSAFPFVDVVYHIDLCMLNHPCDSRMNPVWSWHMIPFTYGWVQLASVSWNNFCIYIHQRYWSVIYFIYLFFWHCLLLVLLGEWQGHHSMNLEMFPPLQFFELFWAG